MEGRESFDFVGHGAPGSGKSVLAAIVVQDLLKSGLEASVASFFCDYAIRKQQDPRSILQSLLRRLIKQAKDSVILGLARFREETKGEPDVKMLTEMAVKICELTPMFLNLDAPMNLSRREQSSPSSKSLPQLVARFLSPAETPQICDIIYQQQISWRFARSEKICRCSWSIASGRRNMRRLYTAVKISSKRSSRRPMECECCWAFC